MYKNLLRDIFSIVPCDNSTKLPSQLKAEFSEQTRSRIVNHVKIHIKTLKDHIQDNNLRLIDTIIFLEQKIKTAHDPWVQFIVILVLDELIKNMCKFTHNIKIKFHSMEEESKYDLMESIDKSYKDEEKEMTLLSDNFIKFEAHYIEIICYLIDQKNHFTDIIQSYAIQSIRNFSKFRKESFTSDKLLSVISRLQEFLASEFNLPAAQQNPSRFADLLECMEATLDKTPINDQFFSQNVQIIKFVLQLIYTVN